MTTSDTPLYAEDLKKLLNIKHSSTLLLKIKSGAVPPPDVKISQKSRYWHKETLRAAGLLPKLEGGAT